MSQLKVISSFEEGGALIGGSEGADFIGASQYGDTVWGYGGDDTIFADNPPQGPEDLLIGGDDLVFAGEGNDIVSGGAGNDTLYGEEGDDRLWDGLGSDVLDGGAGNDMAGFGDYISVDGVTGLVIDLVAGSGGDSQLISIENILGTAYNDTMTGDDGANLIWGDWGDDLINGGLGDDTLEGHDGADVLEGSYGNDILRGGEGDDLLDGGWGADVHDGGAGNDTVDFGYYTGSSTLFIDLSEGNSGYEKFIDVENAIGSNMNDWIRGTVGDNILVGNDGDDTLIGGDGFNELTGGNGADVFVFDLDVGAGEISDFTLGVDKIDLSSTGLQFSDIYLYQIDETTTGVHYAGYEHFLNIYLVGVSASDLSEDDFIFG